jgi:hypothetical protein
LAQPQAAATRAGAEIGTPAERCAAAGADGIEVVVNIPNDVEPIDPAILAAARLRAKRSIAIALIAAMREDGVTFEQLGARLHCNPARVRRWLFGLIDGRTKAADQAIDLATCMGREFEFAVRRIHPPELAA